MAAKQQVVFRESVLTDLLRIVTRYEPYYLSEEERAAFRSVRKGITRERYAKFEAWQGQVFVNRACSSQIDPETLVVDIQRALTGYTILYDWRQEVSADEATIGTYKGWKPGRFQFMPDDLPAWDALPSVEQLKREYLFSAISTAVYTTGRKFKDPKDDSFLTKETLKHRQGFGPTDQDLLDQGYAVDDPVKRQAFLASVDVDLSPEALPLAYFLNFRNPSLNKNGVFPGHLTTNELLCFFDTSNVRPATFPELLAYAKKYWHTQARFSAESKKQVVAFGSIFSGPGGKRYVPYIKEESKGRKLDFLPLQSLWMPSMKEFLVFQKDV